MKIAFISSNKLKYIRFLKEHPEYTNKDVIWIDHYEKIAGLEIDGYFIDECKEMSDADHDRIFNYLQRSSIK